MIFNQLTNNIRKASDTLRSFAGKVINQFLTVRNWLIGYYIVEFEQRGEDRAQYGEQLLQSLAKELKDESLSYRNLRLYRQFYQTYPQMAQVIPAFLQKNKLLSIGQSLIGQFQNKEYQDVEIVQSVITQSEQDNLSIWQSPIAKLQNGEKQKVEIGQSLIAQSNSEEILVEPQRLLSELSYTHLVQLFPIKDRLKRAFYEIECGLLGQKRNNHKS